MVDPQLSDLSHFSVSSIKGGMGVSEVGAEVSGSEGGEGEVPARHGSRAGPAGSCSHGPEAT